VFCPAFRPRTAAPLCALGLLLLAALPAPAVILKLTPLKDVLEGEELIFVASVDSVSPEKPAVVFTFDQKLKGDAPFDRLPVNLTGDAEAKKDSHTKVILDRLEPGRKLIVFASKRGKKYNGMAFIEGTWFSLQGTLDDDGKTVRWAFLHCEPYLRRTFKGTTAELKTVVADGLSKKAEPPTPNDKEPPGYGPPIQKSDKKCSGSESLPTGAGSSTVHRTPSLALLGVVPSLALIAPLALIGALFPGVAVRMAVVMKRWRAFLVIASTNSSLALLYFFFRDFLPDWRMFNYQGFTALLLISTTVGLVWAGRRYRRMAAEEPAVTGTPGRMELYALAGLAGLVGLLVASARLFGPWSLAVDLPLREFTLIGLALLAATFYAGYRVATGTSDHRPDGTTPEVRLSLSGESVGLCALFLGGLVALLIGGEAGSHTATLSTQVGEAGDAIGPRLADVRVFEIPDAHQVMSAVTIDGDRLYFGAQKAGRLSSADGFVFCLDRNTGKQIWKFEADDDLKPVFCTPTVVDGRVYVGEGLHTDKACRLFCLDAATKKPLWDKPFATSSHTEGTPRLANGKLYFTAGDDGLFCVAAQTGERRWQFEGHGQQLHIDGPPAVAGNRVFVGSGLYTLALLGVDAETGKEIWRRPVPLRSFGAPLVIGNRVVYGLGTGNLGADTCKYDEEKGKPEEPTAAGAVVCVEAETGQEAWSYELPRSVHTPLAADAFSVYAASRDGAVYCLDRRTGKLRWKTGIGATCTAGPAVATAGGMPVAVYAVSTEGRMTCLNPQTGQAVWLRDMQEHTKKLVEDVYATPTVVTESTPTGTRRVIYTGAMLKTANTGAKTAAVFRFEDELGD
jgi:outer membrane protein assembly factor BamB